jgi:pre-mRNA-splicing factor ISY1
MAKEEKAQSMLNKWWSMKRALYVRDPDEPPPLVEDCNSLKECYRWRETIMKEIGDKVAEIQNAGLGNYRIRALNDEINKLMNHKRMWERRIRELGGPDFMKTEAKFYDSEGMELPGSGGYRYFGAAKDLPGVRELFFKEAPAAPEKNLKELLKTLDANYFQDNEQMDTRLVSLIQAAESKARAKHIESWFDQNYDRVFKKYPTIDQMTPSEIEAILQNDDFDEANAMDIEREQRQIEEKLLQQRKKDLLRAFVGEFEDEHQGEATESNPLVFTQEY